MEAAEVNFTGVLIFLGILALMLVFVYVSLSGYFGSLTRRATQRDERLMQQRVLPAVAASRAYFPQPNEQVSPRDDLRELRAREDAELNSYGWIDRKAGAVRIPIDRAMELILQRGLPVRTGTNAVAGPSSLQLQQARPTTSTPPEKEEGK